MFQFVVVATLALACVVQCQDQVTMPTTKAHHHHSHAPHTTAESNEKEKYSFQYDGKMHDLVVRMGHNCYIMPLTDKQRQQVHDPSDIKTVEAAALKLIIDNSVQSTIDQTTLNHHLAHDCKGANNVIQLVNN